MRNKVRGRLLAGGSYAIAGAIAVAAFGHCLFGSCLPGSGVAQAASAGARATVEGTATGGQARTSGEQAAQAGESAAEPDARASDPADRPVGKTGKVIARDFEISGMFCAGCAVHVGRAVRKLPGVRDVKIDYETGKGTISYEEGKVDPDKLIDAIKKAGYKAKPVR